MQDSCVFTALLLCLRLTLNLSCFLGVLWRGCVNGFREREAGGSWVQNPAMAQESLGEALTAAHPLEGM